VPRSLEALLSALSDTEPAPVYLVTGDLVLAEPAAERLGAMLAERAGCRSEIHRRPPSLAALLDDLRTYSLFSSAKVVVAVDTAALADRHAVAELIDDAAEALPAGGGELAARERQAASRLLQALRLCGIDPYRGEPAEALAALPDGALAGGGSFRRKRGGRGRGSRQVADLRDGLAELLAAARAAELSGWAEGDLASLSAAIEDGLPPGHTLVLAERTASSDHPVVAGLVRRGLAVEVGELSSERGGGWQGLDLLAAELERQTGVGIAGDALDELARRSLRQESDRGSGRQGGGGGGVDAASSSRFAAEYRKLATLASGRIDRRLVEEAVEDRGEEDVWQLLDAVGEGRGGEALGRLGRMMAGASDPIATRLSFFALLAGFCRHLAAVRGMMELQRVPAGERSYPRFKSRWAGRLQGEIAGGAANPLAGLHPYRLHRAYLAAARFDPATAAALPWRVLETELRLKGESGDADTALAELVAHLAAAS
jgi:DNA polymerase III delta subunit